MDPHVLTIRGRYWYRNEAEHFHVFKGKISASRLFDFIFGRYFDESGLKGSNNLMRFGRATESKVVLTHLLRFQEYSASESGTYPHPRIKDSCGTPDAFLCDPKRTFKSLPEWVQTMWLAEPEARRTAIDWTRGILEVKTMLKLDFKRLGPVIKAEHICQMYWTMLCTGAAWGEYIRFCDETKESRVFRIYLNPAVARKLEACVERMRNEMIAGSPYKAACDHEVNAELVLEFRAQATRFNLVTMDVNGERKKYYSLGWPSDDVALLEKMAEDYDICFVDRPPASPSSAEPAKKRARKKATTVKAPRATPAPTPVQTPMQQVQTTTPAAGPVRLTPASLMPMLEQQSHQTIAALVDDLDATHRVLIQCLRNMDYDAALSERVFHAQQCRLLEIHGLCKAVEAIKQEKKEGAPEQDE